MTAKAIQVEGIAGGTAVPVSFAPGGLQDVNVAEYDSVAVGPLNAVHVQPGTGAVFPISITGGQGVGIDDWLGSTAPTVGQKVAADSLPVVLASNDTRFSSNPADNTTTQLATELYVWNGAGWDKVRGSTTSGARVALERITQIVAVSPAANAGATITLPAPGGGLFHYITHISICRHATAALAGAGTLAITTTNLNGVTWRTGNQASITVATNGIHSLEMDFAHPLRSAVANVATTIVLPAPGAAVLWTAWCAYYNAPLN